jgi:hypothetical protein
MAGLHTSDLGFRSVPSNAQFSLIRRYATMGQLDSSMDYRFALIRRMHIMSGLTD